MLNNIRKNKTNVKEVLKGLKKENGQLSIDEIDKKILRLLIWNARLSYREISRQLKLSTGTVIERLKRMKSGGVISGYSVNIDSKKLGYDITAIIELVAPKLILKKAMKDISSLRNVYGIYHTTGDIDAVIITKFRNISELNTFLDNLYKDLDIIRTETRIVFSTVKEDFRTLID